MGPHRTGSLGRSVAIILAGDGAIRQWPADATSMFSLVILNCDSGGNALREFPFDYCARRVYLNHFDEDGKGSVIGV